MKMSENDLIAESRWLFVAIGLISYDLKQEKLSKTDKHVESRGVDGRSTWTISQEYYTRAFRAIN